jgi:hypothetical protein
MKIRLIIAAGIITVVIIVALLLQNISSTSGPSTSSGSVSTSGPSTSSGSVSTSGPSTSSGSVRMPSDHHVAWMNCRSTGDRGDDSLLDRPDEDGYKEAWKQCRDETP